MPQYHPKRYACNDKEHPMESVHTAQEKEDLTRNDLLARIWIEVCCHPEAPAFRMLDEEPLSYAELWKRSSVLAQKLEEVRSDRIPVIVLGCKCPDMLCSLLACLRAGHAFVPVHTSMPQSRVETMCEEIEESLGSAPTILLATSRDEAAKAGHHEPDMLCAPEILASAELPQEADLMPNESRGWVSGEETQYIIFTSGSTGKPKGIEVTENDVRHFMEWLETFPAIRDHGQVFMDQAPYSFDLSEFELVGALSTGGSLYALAPESATDFKRLFAELKDSHMNVWVSTPPFADMCLADPSFSSELLPDLKLFLFCGDTLSHRTARGLKKRFPDAVVANTYGPTESTVAVTYAEMTDEMVESDEALPVGYPRPHTELHVYHIDEPDGPLGAECAPGESGEVVIVGDTVAKDYLGEPEKTAHAFSEATLADGTKVRAFRTGDIGHVDEDGMLHYEGRMGSLIKLNGFRIELGDVEHSLRGLAGVKAAAVVPVKRRDRISALKAFVVLDHKEPTADETPRAIRMRLAESLPAYMVPKTVKVLDEMPLTTNAKIDRKMLAQA
ncbi:MAG: AMP-binding protein [Atopobiaceae bacterium]